MKFDDTKKIFENWKGGINNRIDEMFIPSLGEAAPDEPEKGDGVVDKDEEDTGVLLGEEPKPLEEINPVPTPIPKYDHESLEETVRAKIREAILGVFLNEQVPGELRGKADDMFADVEAAGETASTVGKTLGQAAGKTASTATKKGAGRLRKGLGGAEEMFKQTEKVKGSSYTELQGQEAEDAMKEASDNKEEILNNINESVEYQELKARFKKLLG